MLRFFTKRIWRLFFPKYRLQYLGYGSWHIIHKNPIGSTTQLFLLLRNIQCSGCIGPTIVAKLTGHTTHDAREECRRYNIYN